MSNPMKNRILIFILGTLGLSFSEVLTAQTPTDGIMMRKGEICFAGIYGNDSWDEYWEGTLKRQNGNIGTFTRESITGMFALGITDRINVIGIVPWMHTEASQGQLRGVSGISDVSVFIKAQAFHITAGPGKLAFNPTIGITTPVSNYLEDYAPFSLGMGCIDLTLRGNLQYKLNMGVYVRGTAAYQVRSNSKIERDYYYTTHGVYSDEVDVPNALTYTATLGGWFLQNSLNLDVTYDGLTSYGGFDIRRQDAGFPGNKMVYTRIGGNLHYYFPFAPGLGIVGGYGKVLTGRNVGQSENYFAGLTYQFQLFNKTVAETQSK
jgi:hypothetical protein